MKQADHTSFAKGYLFAMFKGGLFYSVLVVFGKTLLFLHSILLSRMLPIDDVGVFYLGQTSVLLLTGFLLMGLDVGLIRFVAISQVNDTSVRPSTLISGSALLSMSVTIPVIVVMALCSRDIGRVFLKIDGLEGVFTCFVIAVPFVVIMRLFLSATRGLKIVSYTAVIEQVVTGILLFSFSAIVLFLSNTGLNGLALAYLVTSALTCAAAYLCMRRHFSLKFSGIRWAALKPVVAFSTPLIVSQWLFFLVSYLNSFMLAYWGVSRDIALYNTALRIMLVAEVVANSVVVVFNPVIAELVAQKRFSELRSSYRSASRWVFMLCCPFFAAAMYFPGLFLGIFGRDFLAAGPCLMIICASALLEYSIPMLGSMIAMSGHTKMTLLNNLASLCSLVVCGFLLIPRMGVNGVAVAWAVSSVVLTTLRLIESRQLFRLQPFQINHLKICGASLLSWGLLRLVSSSLGALPAPIALAVVLVTGFAVYALLIRVFGMEADDILILTEMKKRIKRGLTPA